MSRDGKKTGGRDFKPGQSGNPLGRPQISDHLRAARRVNSKTFIEHWLEDDRGLQIVKKLFAIAADEEHEHYRWAVDHLILRVFGKVKEQVTVTTGKLTAVHRPNGSTFVMGRIEEEE